MRRNINIQGINKNPATKRLRCIFANRYASGKKKRQVDEKT